MYNSSAPTTSSQEDQLRPVDANAAHMTHGINTLRGLSSQESIGPGWDPMSAADDGMIRLLQGEAEPGPYDFLRALDQHPTPSPSSSQMSNAYNLDGFASQPQIPTLLSGDLPSSLPPSHNQSPEFAHAFPQHISPAQLTMSLDRSNPVSPNPYPTPGSTTMSGSGYAGGFQFDFSTNTGGDHRRSASATSHHTTSNSVSGGSDCSYSATDVSEGEDAEMALQQEEMDGLGGLNFGRIGLKGEKTWTQYDQDALSGGGGASGAGTGQSGAVRRSSAGAAPKVEKDKLEHRRSINRKSAQKHRARRKEELEELAIKIAERDARIAQLERDLAVEKAKSVQLMEFVRGRAGGGASSTSAAGSSRSSARDTSESGASRGDGPERGAKKTEGRRTRGMNKAEDAQAGEGLGTIHGDGRDAGW